MVIKDFTSGGIKLKTHMTQEQRDLLLKDLSMRLPYGIKVQYENEIFDLEYVCPMYEEVKLDNHETWTLDISEVKPYLFPLSSMTEEQWNNAPRVNLTEFTFESLKCGCFTLASYTCENDLYDLVEFINWLLENHFDIYGLIPMGLANDATDKGIY